MKRYTTMVFDVGGTLLRFDLDRLTDKYVELCARRGVIVEPQHAHDVLLRLELELPNRSRERQISLEQGYGIGFWDDFYWEGFRRLGVKADMSAEAAWIREHFQRAEFETLHPDVIPALDALKRRGVTLGILSNFSPNCEQVLELVGIHDYFAFFVVSAIAGIEKPDERIFDLTVQAARSPRAEIVYIGDSLFHDVEGAERAGIDAILVDRHNAHTEFGGPRVHDLLELTAFAGTGQDAN